MGQDKDGNQLGPKRPRSLLEKGFGIAGGIAAAAWIFNLFLRIIDAIARVQTVMALEPYVRYLATWWAQLIELALAVSFIVVATKIEQSRETEDAPRIILLDTREPTPVQRERLWMKVTAAGTLLAGLAAGGVFLSVKRSSAHIPQNVAVSSPALKSKPALQAGAAQATEPNRDTKPSSNPAKRNAAPKTVLDKSTAQSPPSPPISVVIPVPDQVIPPRAASGKSAVKYVTQIGGQVAEAKSKAPGTLTVSLAATSNSQYLGNITPANVSDVVEALRKTGKISVLLNQSAGSYSISGNGLGYSMSLTQIHPRTIYFFDHRLESACAAVKTIVSSVVGQMDCKFVSVQPSSDPNQPNPGYDFLVQSGLDMEIDL